MPKPSDIKPKAPKDLAQDPAFIQLGEFGRAHGLKGEIRLKSFTADPLAIAGYRPLLTATGQAITILSLRPAGGRQPDLFVARVEGVDDRTGAEALNQTGLYVARASLPAPQQDEYLHADLIGLMAVDPLGQEIGKVTAIHDYGAGDILEIAPSGLLVPFTKAFVPGVDLARKLIVVDYAENQDGQDEDGQDMGKTAAEP